MRGRLIVTLGVACVVALGHASSTHAAIGDTTRTDNDESKGAIVGVAERRGWSGSGSGSRCTWRKVTSFGLPTVGGSDAIDGGHWSEMAERGNVLYYRSGCSDGRPDGYVWVPPVTTADVRTDALRRVERLLPDPSLLMSPDPAVGGFVNLGLWLAVDDPGTFSATAAVGPVWVTVTARYDHSLWSMGNGDAVQCTGLGTPIVDLDTTEEGPCGYTYRQPSTPQQTGDELSYHASVRGSWTITWQDYRGESGTLTPIYRTTAFDFQVREIQTVGVPNP